MRLNMSVTRTLIAAAMAVMLAFGSTVKPAAADQTAATRNAILGGLAAIAIGLTVANVSHKNAVANTVEGYTPDGSTVYGDGHVVLSDGESYYPGNNGQSIACDNGQCDVSGSAYNGYNGYNNNYNGYNDYNGNGYRYEQQRRRR